jgi:hypothetical protein
MNSTYHCMMCSLLPFSLPFSSAMSLYTISISNSNVATSPCAISLAFYFPTRPSYTLNANIL